MLLHSEDNRPGAMTVRVICYTPFGQEKSIVIPAGSVDYINWTIDELMVDLTVEWWPEYCDQYDDRLDFYSACGYKLIWGDETSLIKEKFDKEE